MKLKALSDVRSRDEARSIAINFQFWFSDHSVSQAELLKYNHYFESLARKFRLSKEFRENGII